MKVTAVEATLQLKVLAQVRQVQNPVLAEENVSLFFLYITIFFKVHKCLKQQT